MIIVGVRAARAAVTGGAVPVKAVETVDGVLVKVVEIAEIAVETVMTNPRAI
jgi:hypothetical protein